MSEDTQMTRLNECARIVYETMGCRVEKGYDFSTARHPQERACFAIAVKTFNYWKPILAKRKTQKTKKTRIADKAMSGHE